MTAADLRATSSTLEDATRVYVHEITRGPTKEYPLVGPHQWYRATHRDEIRKTLEIVRVEEEAPFGVAFYRFSVGTLICRDTQFFQNLDGIWLPTYIPHFSEYSPLETTIHIEHLEFLEKVEDESEGWTKDQPNCWFL